MSSYIPRALTKKYRERLQRRLEKWTGPNTPISINDALTLLRHVETLEKEADWLAEQASLMCDCIENCDECRLFLDCQGKGCKEVWRDSACKAVEENSK